MPGMYSGSDYDIAGFAVGAVERDQVLPQKDVINPGDVVIGLGSSGIHSNGFSLVQKVVDMAGLNFDSPCPFPTVEGIQSMKTLGEAFLTPTQIYCKAVLPHMREGKIKAFAHITGTVVFYFSLILLCLCAIFSNTRVLHFPLSLTSLRHCFFQLCSH